MDGFRRQPFKRQAPPCLAAIDFFELLAVLVIGGNHQDAVRTIAHCLAAQIFDFVHKARIEVAAGRTQLEESVKADHLSLRRNHSRSRAACLAAGLASVEHYHLQASLRQAKGNRAANHAAADDDHVCGSR